MRILCRWLLALALLAQCTSRVWSAAATEKGAFNSAAEAFQAGFYARAEAEFGAFTQQFTNSTRVPEAVLFQAKARMQLTNYAGAIELLSAYLPRADKWADEYVFSLGEASLRKGDFPKAAEYFADLANRFPGSPRRLEAAVNEATARARVGEWSRVVDLLQQTNGVFQSVVRNSGVTNQLAIRGYLMIGEAQMALQQYAAAEKALQPILEVSLAPKLAWQRQYLLCRSQSAQGHLNDALVNVTNLLNLATNTGQASLQADSVALQAGLLEQLSRRDEAMETYEKNLTAGVPAERQRQALLKIIELSLLQNKIPRAAQMLEKYCQQSVDTSSRDLALLTLGELRLRQYAAEPPGTNSTAGVTNLLQEAEGVLNALVKEFPNSEWLGKAHLNLGWCFWLGEKLPEARNAFEQAVRHLPASTEKATAHFKLGDVDFRLNDFAGALTNYNAVIEEYSENPDVKSSLLEPALYQAVRAGLAKGDLGASTAALTNILARYPNGFDTERAVLLIGQKVGREGNPEKARQIFQDFTRAATNSPLLPQLQMAIAGTYERQSQWEHVIEVYDGWLSRFTNAPSLQEEVEYRRALAFSMAGRVTNAYSLFTNFVTQYPTNEFTPLAQWWVADYCYRNARWRQAEENYQLIFQRWPLSPVASEAKLMAGRTAVSRQVWTDAIRYFTNLTSDAKCPPDLWVRAMFAYGDVLMSMDSTNKQADYEQAIGVFTKIADSYPTNPVAVLAIGEKANCLLQWAQFTKQYEPALKEFARITDSPLANATVRGIARVGMGVVEEKLAEQRTGADQAALLQSALNHYLDVLYFEKDLKEAEKPDPFWVKKAGLEAARLAESRQEWMQAIKIYERLRALMPALGPTLDKKTAKAAEQLTRAKN
jgi:TolA-binding protein